MTEIRLHCIVTVYGRGRRRWPAMQVASAWLLAGKDVLTSLWTLSTTRAIRETPQVESHWYDFHKHLRKKCINRKSYYPKQTTKGHELCIPCEKLTFIGQLQNNSSLCTAWGSFKMVRYFVQSTPVNTKFPGTRKKHGIKVKSLKTACLLAMKRNQNDGLTIKEWFTSVQLFSRGVRIVKF